MTAQSGVFHRIWEFSSGWSVTDNLYSGFQNGNSGDGGGEKQVPPPSLRSGVGMTNCIQGLMVGMTNWEWTNCIQGQGIQG